MYDRPTPNLFLQYQYNLEYESDEKKHKCQLEDYQLIQYHIIQTIYFMFAKWGFKLKT